MSFTGHNPPNVTFAARSVAATSILAPLTAKKNSTNWWLFNSGLADGTIFAKNATNCQLLSGVTAFGAAQRMGKRDEDGFILVIKDNA